MGEGGAAREGGVIHSAETLHFNPIYSLPQQKIITTLKPARRGEKEKASLTQTVPLAPEVSTKRKRGWAGEAAGVRVAVGVVVGGGPLLAGLKQRHCDKLRVCVANEAK